MRSIPTSSIRSRNVAGEFEAGCELGWIEGRTVGDRVSLGRGTAWSVITEIAAEFVRLKVDVIVTSGDAARTSPQQATSVIPIVFTMAPQSDWQRTSR